MSIRKISRKNGTAYRVKVMRSGRLVSKSFRNKRDALLYENEVFSNEELVNTKDYTFKEAAEEWIVSHAEVRKAGSGVMEDKRMLKKNIYPTLANLKISRIQPHHIDGLIMELLKRRLSNNTVNRNLCVVRTILNFCKRRRWILTNPMDAVPQLKTDIRDFKYWSLKDARSFLEHARKKYEGGSQYSTYLLYLTALNTGLRMGELLALKWHDLDFDNRIITIRRTFSCHERQVRESTKSGKARHVPLNSAMYDSLYEAYRRRGNIPWAFHWDGNIIDPHNLRSRCFEKDIIEAGVEPIRFHDIRHTFASHYMMNGGNPYDLQKILGHSTLRMTERYAHLSKAFLASKGDTVSFTESVNVIRVDFKATGTEK